jgi:hypothetical protein
MSDFKLNASTQSVGELWESIATIAQGRVNDNNLPGDYPLSLRKRQLESISSLVITLELSHKAIEAGD